MKGYTLAREWHESVAMKDAPEVGDVDSCTDQLLRAQSQAAIEGEPIRSERAVRATEAWSPMHQRIRHPSPVWLQVVHMASELCAAEVAAVLTRKRSKSSGRIENHVTARKMIACAMKKAKMKRAVYEQLPVWRNRNELAEDRDLCVKVLTEAPEYAEDIKDWAVMLSVEYGDA